MPWHEKMKFDETHKYYWFKFNNLMESSTSIQSEIIWHCPFFSFLDKVRVSHNRGTIHYIYNWSVLLRASLDLNMYNQKIARGNFRFQVILALLILNLSIAAGNWRQPKFCKYSQLSFWILDYTSMLDKQSYWVYLFHL